MRMAFWKARGNGSEQPNVETSSEARSAEPSAGQVAGPSLPGSHIDQMLLRHLRAHPARCRMVHSPTTFPSSQTCRPNSFGIAIATTKGKVHTIGDADLEFTIQSTSKALTYCMALELCGRNEVLACVGVEPSGDPFNAIEFSPITRRPYNPMVNAGAIAMSGMLRDTLGAEAAFDLRAREVFASGRAAASAERGRVSLRNADRSPQPGDRASALERRRLEGAGRAGARSLLQAMLDHGDADRPRRDRRDHCEPRRASGHRPAGLRHRCGARHAVGDVLVRHVRLSPAAGPTRSAFPPRAASAAEFSASSIASSASAPTRRVSIATATRCAASPRSR